MDRVTDLHTCCSVEQSATLNSYRMRQWKACFWDWCLFELPQFAVSLSSGDHFAFEQFWQGGWSWKFQPNLV